MELDFKDIALKFEGSDKPALRNLSGKFVTGELTAIMGPSGCGKSTFINVLCGYVDDNARTGGTVSWDGKERDNSYSEIVAQLCQDDHYDPSSTVFQLLYYNALGTNRDLTKEQITSKINFLLEKMFLQDMKDHLIGTLSGGERKRVVVISELLSNAKIIFLDEPTSGLDSHLAIELIYFLKTFKDKMIVVSIHQPSPLIIEAIDKFAFIDQGKMIYCGPIDETEKFFETIGVVRPSNMVFYEFLFLVSSYSYFNDDVESQKKSYVAYRNSIDTLEIMNSTKSNYFSTKYISAQTLSMFFKRYFTEVFFRQKNETTPKGYISFIYTFILAIGLCILFAILDRLCHGNQLPFTFDFFFVIVGLYLFIVKIGLPNVEYAKIEIRKRRVSFLELFFVEVILCCLILLLLLPLFLIIRLCVIGSQEILINLFFCIFPILFSMLIFVSWNFMIQNHIGFTIVGMIGFISNSSFIYEESAWKIVKTYGVLNVLLTITTTILPRNVCLFLFGFFKMLFCEYAEIDQSVDFISPYIQLALILGVNGSLLYLSIRKRYYSVVPKYRYKLKND